jgi:hypothetical protein
MTVLLDLESQDSKEALASSADTEDVSREEPIEDEEESSREEGEGEEERRRQSRSPHSRSVVSMSINIFWNCTPTSEIFCCILFVSPLKKKKKKKKMKGGKYNF